MAYNLYQVQMAKAWAERIDKENAQAEKFWHTQSMKTSSLPASPSGRAPVHIGEHHFTDTQSEVRSHAGSAGPRSAAPTGYTSKTTYLRSRMEQLEVALNEERESRKKVEEDLQTLRQSLKRR